MIYKENNFTDMEELNKFGIQFSNELVIMELVKEEKGVSKYQLVRHLYDLDNDEHQTLTLTVDIAPVTNKEKRSTLLFNMFKGVTIKKADHS